ncbi:hypothetical protein D3C72_1910090 [compost metagenome]
MWHSTSWTDPKWGFNMPTVMAMHHIGTFMVGQTDITIHTFGNKTAGITLDHGGVSPSILKQNNLFLILNGFFNSF